VNCIEDDHHEKKRKRAGEDDDDRSSKKATAIPSLNATEVATFKITSAIPELSYSSPLPYQTSFQPFPRSEFMFASCLDYARTPPLETIDVIKQLDAKFEFGKRLRQCTEPDFIFQVSYFLFDEVYYSSYS
jgi:hypothetical protein